MNKNLAEIKTAIYDTIPFQITNFNKEMEGKEYDACRFELNGMKIICRSAKITPKKVGQFVTFWKRNNNGITEPFNDKDQFDFFIINVNTSENCGQFVFPKSVLIHQGIISTNKKDGKRGFRVYPKWDKTTNKQAEKTQEWQLKYFYKLGTSIDLNQVKELYLKAYE